MPKMTVTKQEALRVLELDGTSPSAADIQMHYQKLALKFHPTRRGANLQSIERFDRLCRSYLILTEGRESMTKLLSQAEMLDVFVKAFELEGMRIKKEATAEDASTQCDRPSTSTSKSISIQTSWTQHSASKSTASTASVGTTTSNGATASVGTSTGRASASARAATSVGATTSTGATTSIGATTSTGTVASTGTTASAGTTTCNGATTAAATSSTGKKPAVPEKEKQNIQAVAAASIEEKSQEKKKKKKASKKSRKRRQQREKQQLNKESKSDSSSSSEDEKKETDEDEDELDPNSAFVAMALSRKTKGAVPKSSVSSGGVIPKTPNKSTEDVVTRSRKLAREGYEMCNLGRHKDAVELFTQAIKLYAQEHSYFGNRSYCYSILGKYDKALKDAEKAIGLQPQLAKGYFRRAKAQLGLQKYTEAAESFKRVLEIDPTCLEARTELRSVHVFEIMSMGFTQEQAEWSLTHGNEDVQTAINILCGPDAVVPDVKMNPCNMDGFRSLWVGNIQPEVTEKMLTDLFRRYGDVHSIRILHDRHCAFINYGNKLSPGKAMEALQGHVLCGTAILIRFPDNNYLENGSKKDPVTVLRKSSLKMSAEEHKAASASSESKAKVSGPVNGNECYFWRTTGCSYGDNCYYEHIPSHKGIDWKAQRSNGKFK
uniref:Heat shock protein n=1 Tax=Rhipicephalus appendiculatus TaxID=34631 RepID=A0A131Z5K2_RHIAP